MRKQYAKPMLYAESFTLVEHISAGCGWVSNFGVDCPLNDDGLIVFARDGVCSPDAISMIQFAMGEDYDLSGFTMEDMIKKVNPRCYNSFAEYSQLYTSI